MKKNKNTQILIIGLLTTIILAMSIIFAAYSTTLNMTGSVAVTNASWNIHFETKSPISSSITTSTGSEAVTVSALDGTSLTWSTTLAEPGDYAEFTINVLNEGTFNANLSSVTMTALTTAQSKYLTYSVTYDGSNNYTSTTTGITGITLAKKSGSTATSVPVKIRVAYVQPTNESDLPSTTQTITLTTALKFDQA